jgi:hypothetical protein
VVTVTVGAPRSAGVSVGDAMDHTESGSCERHEQPGTVPYVDGHGLPAHKPGADEAVRVACVEACAGGADAGTAVAAADGEPLERFAGRVVVVQDLPRDRVTGGGGAGEVDGVGTATGCGDLLHPACVLRMVGEADDVAFGVGEPAQARRVVEDGAPGGLWGVGGDGGALSGWAVETTARRDAAGGRRMVITPSWAAALVDGSADGAAAAADAAAVPAPGPGGACSLALAGRAADSAHGHACESLLPIGQVWRKPRKAHCTVEAMESLRGEAAR